MNVYLYVGNNPINHIDPEGLEKDADDVVIHRDGHHVNPAANWKNNKDLSPEVRQRLDGQRVKPDADSVENPAHGNSRGHELYRQRTKRIQDEMIDEARKKGVDPSKLTGKQAEDFADELAKRVMKDEYCSGFNALIKEGSGTTTKLNALREAFLKAEGKQGWLKAFRGGKALPVIGTAVGLYFLATSADAEEAIGVVLPPGADMAWSYSCSSYDKACRGTASIGEGNATSDQLQSPYPFVSGISQARKAEKDLMNDMENPDGR